MVEKAIPQKVRKEIKAFVKVLKRDKLPIQKVILFGSFSRGNQKKWSDIDLCIISPKFKDSFSAMQYLWLKRIKDEGLTIEPVGFSPQDFEKEDSFIREIKETGVELVSTIK